MVSCIQKPHMGKINIQDFCSLKYILYLQHGEGWPRTVTLLLLNALVLLSRLKANVTKFSQCANGTVQQCWFVPIDIKCWSSHFFLFSLEVLAQSCERVLTSRVCLFYFCHHLSILGRASVLNAIQEKKLRFLFHLMILYFTFSGCWFTAIFSYSGLSSDTPVLT